MPVSSVARSVGLVRFFTFACAVTSAAAHAEPSEPRMRFEATLVDLGVAPECAASLGDFLAPVGDSAPATPGVALERTPPDGHGILARLERSGGVPFWGPSDRLARGAARFDAEFQAWLPRRDDLIPNRGYARWTPRGGRELLVVDHMRSPISSATSIWEDTGKAVVLRAEFPAEIQTIEDRGAELVLHTSDTFNTVAVVWDVASGSFVGRCLVRADAATSSQEPLSELVLGVTPRAARLKAKQPLMMWATAAPDGGNARLDSVARGEHVIVLVTRPEGAALVLAPWRDKTAATKLFRQSSGRLWQLGWVAGSALATP